MELHPPARVSDAEAQACESYVDRLGLEPRRRQALLAHVCRSGADPVARLTAVHAALSPDGVTAGMPAFGSIGERLKLALTRAAPEPQATIATDAQGHTRLVTTPAFNRSSMAPRCRRTESPRGCRRSAPCSSG
jgi:hypothetical protein